MSPDLAALAFDTAPIGIVLTENRVIRSANRRFGEMTGHDHAALQGQSFRLFYDSDRAFDATRDIGLAPLRSGRDYADERLLRHRSGAQILVRFQARTLDPQSPLSRLVMTFQSLAGETPQRALTPRERSVVNGLSRGQTSKEIARELGLSPRTVEDVRFRLLRRYGARNAADLLSRLSGPAF